MKKIKVLHFELSQYVGGIEKFMLNLYSNIDRSKFQFDFVTTCDHPALENELTELGARIYKVPEYKNYFEYKKSIKVILNKHYDIVHIHKNSAANIVPFKVASQFPNLKIVAHSHNTHPTISGPTAFLHKLNMNKLYSYANEHLACSEDAGIWLYGNKSFKVIRNGINASKYRYSEESSNKIRNELNIPQDALVIGNIGRFSLQKNHEKLVDIFYEIKKLEKNSILLIIGEGPLFNKITEQCGRLGIRESVRLVGRRTDIPELLSSMNCFVMPSLYEGLSIATVEAQAAGLPLFLSNTISKQTEITDGIHWFSLNDNSTSIGQKILNGMKAEHSIKKRLERNKMVINAGYDISKTVDSITRVYQTLSRVESL